MEKTIFTIKEEGGEGGLVGGHDSSEDLLCVGKVGKRCAPGQGLVIRASEGGDMGIGNPPRGCIWADCEEENLPGLENSSRKEGKKGRLIGGEKGYGAISSPGKR